MSGPAASASKACAASISALLKILTLGPRKGHFGGRPSFSSVDGIFLGALYYGDERRFGRHVEVSVVKEQRRLRVLKRTLPDKPSVYRCRNSKFFGHSHEVDAPTDDGERYSRGAAEIVDAT